KRGSSPGKTELGVDLGRSCERGGGEEAISVGESTSKSNSAPQREQKRASPGVECPQRAQSGMRAIVSAQKNTERDCRARTRRYTFPHLDQSGGLTMIAIYTMQKLWGLCGSPGAGA